MDKNILDMDEEAQIRIEEIGESDILVGIPSYNNERTIAHVIKAVEYGLTKYFLEYKSVLVNSDGGSTAITEGFRMCQANLGAKIHEAKDPSKALGPMFRQVIATTFDLIEREHEYWREVKGSRATAMFGFRPLVAIEPVSVDLESMIRGYKEGYETYKEYWDSFLSKDDLLAIEEIAMLDLDDYHFPADLWVEIMYDFAIGYHRKISGHPTEHDLFFNSLIPLYFGRTASFVIESKDMLNGDAEKLVEDQCKKFEEMKDYLVERW